MVAYYWELLSKTWANVLEGLSTSTLSIIIWSFATPTAIWIILNVVKWRRSMSPLKTIFNESLLSAAVTAGITVLVWIVIIGFYGFKTIYIDHKILTDTNRDLKTQLTIKDSMIKTLQTAKKQKEKDIILALYDFIHQGIVIQEQCRGRYLDVLRPEETLTARFIRWCTDIDDREKGFFVKNLAYEPYHTKFENRSKYNKDIQHPIDVGQNAGIWDTVEGYKRTLEEIIKELEQKP